MTTNPSEFAASLNRIGISYNIGYAVAIALRYIPDVQDDFHKIKNAQEARGIEMSGKAKLMSRIKSTASIIFPLIFTSIGRIDTISNAMELRGYGKPESVPGIWEENYSAMIICVLRWCLDLPWLHL